MPSATERFTIPEDMLLVKCVSKHRCLYDKNHMYHSNWKIKEDLWIEIARTLNRSGEYTIPLHTLLGSGTANVILRNFRYK